jgi:hypothetical protein
MEVVLQQELEIRGSQAGRAALDGGNAEFGIRNVLL